MNNKEFYLLIIKTYYRTLTLYINFILEGFRCIYKFYSVLFVNSLRMSEDNKALLTYL